MLNFPKKQKKYTGKIQSGFYLDYIFKKNAEVFLRNVFIYSALFFGEKYMIEQLTKKVIDSFIFNNNKYVGWSTFNNNSFFYVNISILMYFFFFINIYLYF